MTAYATSRCPAVNVADEGEVVFFPPLTHLKIFIEQSQFWKRLESVVLFPARDNLLCGTGAVAENQIFHPPVEVWSSESVWQWEVMLALSTY